MKKEQLLSVLGIRLLIDSDGRRWYETNSKIFPEKRLNEYLKEIKEAIEGLEEKN